MQGHLEAHHLAELSVDNEQDVGFENDGSMFDDDAGGSSETEHDTNLAQDDGLGDSRGFS